METTVDIDNLEYGLYDYKCNLYLGENARYAAAPFNQVTNRPIRLPDGKSNIVYLWSNNFENSLDMVNNKKFIIPPTYRRVFYPQIIRDRFMKKIFRINLLRIKEKRFDIIREKSKLATFSQIRMPVTDINTFFLLGDIYETAIPIASKFPLIRLMKEFFNEFIRIVTSNTPSPSENINTNKEDGYRVIMIDANSFKFKNTSLADNKLNPLCLFYLTYLRMKDLSMMNVDMDFLICGKNMFMKFNPAKCKTKDLNRFKIGLFRIMNTNFDDLLSKAKDKDSQDIKHPARTHLRHNIINDVIDPYTKGVSPDIKDLIFTTIDNTLSSGAIKNPIKAVKDLITNKFDLSAKSKKNMINALDEIDDESLPTELPEEDNEEEDYDEDETVQNEPLSDEEKDELADESDVLEDYTDDKKAVEEIAKEEIHDDKVKSEVDAAIQDKTIPIKNLRSSSITSARDLKLREEQKKVRVNDSTIDEILSRDVNNIKIKTEDKSKVLKSANPNVSSIRFSNFEKTYLEELYVKDTISMFDVLKDKDSPFYITSIDVKDSSTSLDYKETWTVKLVDENKKHHTIKVDLPKFYNNKFMYLNGNKYIIMKQNFYNPLVKDSPDTVILTTNYNKVTISRKTNKSLSYIEKMFSVMKKSNEKIFIAGTSTKDNAEFVCSLEYDEYAKRLFKFKSKKCEIYFSRKYIKEKLNTDASIKDDEYLIGFEGDIPIIINENSGLDRSGRTITEIMVDNLPENLKTFYASAKGSSQPMYAECKLAGQFMAVGAVLVGWIGLTKLLELMHIEYTILENKRSIKKEDGKGYIKFNDGILVYDNRPVFSQLVLNGILKMKPENFKISDFDTDVPFNSYLYTIWGNYRGITEVNAFYEFLMDPITIEVCKDLALPINIEELMLYAVKMLSDEHFSPKSSDNLYRVRTCEIIPGILYSRIAAQYKEYVKSGRRVPLTLNQNAVIADLVSIPTVEEYSTLNPTLEMTKMYTISAKGYRGSNSDYSYDIEKRSYDKTSIGKLAISSEPNGGVGVTRQMVVEPTISSIRGYRDTVEDIDDLKDVNVMAPIEMLTPGSFRMDDPLRTSMANKQSGHVVPVSGGIPSLISNGFDESVQFHLSNDFVINAEDDGKVIEVDEKVGFIIVQYKNGKTQAINMNPDIVKNSGAGFYLANKMKPTVTKVGETFKKDEPLAYHDKYFKYSKMTGLRYVIGPLAKVAYTSTYNTYEDAGICTKKISDKLRTDVVFLEPATFKRNSNILSIAKIGDHVNIGDSLIKFNISFEDDELAKYITKLSDENKLAFQDELKTDIKTSHAGKIIDIKVYTLLDPDELTPSLAKVVKQFFARGISKKNLLSKYDKTPGIVKCGYMLTDTTEPSVNKYNKIKGKYKGVDVLIEFYIEHSTGLGVGDKVALYTANKNIISEMIPEGYEPYSEFRPDEEVSMLISPGCVARRMVTSILPISATMKVLVELKRKIKEMAKFPNETIKESKPKKIEEKPKKDLKVTNDIVEENVKEEIKKEFITESADDILFKNINSNIILEKQNYSTNDKYDSKNKRKINNIDFKYLYFGTDEKIKNKIILNGPLYVSPYEGIASIFAVAPKVNDLRDFINKKDQKLSEQEIANKYKMNFKEWNHDYNFISKKLTKPLDELHVELSDVNKFDDVYYKKAGYIYKIKINDKIKNHLYQSSKMDEKFEFCIDNLDSVEFCDSEKIIVNVTISYKDPNIKLTIEENCKTPKELNDILNKNFDYGYIKNNSKIFPDEDDNYEDYRTLTIDEFLTYRIGTCYDYSEFEAYFFEKYLNYKMNYNKPLEDNEFSLYFMQIKENNENCPSHSWLAYKENNKIKIFESSWKSHQGIKSFNSEWEMIKYYENEHIKENKINKKHQVFICKYKPFLHTTNYNGKAHLSVEKYISNMYKSGTVIKSDFKEIPIKLNLNKT